MMGDFLRAHRQGASNKTPRQINRNLIFNLIRTHQSISRADLARLSGLQRSTVSLVVEDLIKDRWILEGSTGRPPRGRRPTFLHLNNQRVIVALDVHPTQSTVGIVDIGGKIISQNLINLPKESSKAITAMVATIRQAIAANRQLSFDGIGICLPGRIDPKARKLIFAPNLDWPVLDIKTRIQKAIGLRVEIENAANACAVSEIWFGHSNGIRDLVVVTVSEGIGTGIFVNERLLRGENGMAGEFGHVRVAADGPLCGCGNRGCWETVASNRAALRYYTESTRRCQNISFETLLKLSQNGDGLARDALAKMSVNLGQGIRLIVSALAPKEIVVVGAITTAWHIFGPIIEEQLTNNFVRPPILRPAYNGGDARLRSAVALVFNGGAFRTESR